MNETETFQPDHDFTDRTYKAGGVLLLIAGVIGAIVGLGMLLGSTTGSVFGLNPPTAALLGGVMLVFSVIEFGGGILAYRGSNWYGSMTAAILGLVTVFTLPLDLIGTILIALGEDHFDQQRDDNRLPRYFLAVPSVEVTVDRVLRSASVLEEGPTGECGNHGPEGNSVPRARVRTLASRRLR